MLDKIALFFVIVGALNWGAVGIFQVDVVSMFLGGTGTILSRIIYTLIALGGIWSVSLFFRDTQSNDILDN